MVDPAASSATALLRRLHARAVTSRELTEALLDRAERFDGAVNAVVTRDDAALAAADEADAERAAGRLRGPLHGLPMTVKDVFETRGLRTTAGLPELAGHVPAHDAEAVRRLRAAGALVIGKTNVPASAGDVQTYNDVFGVTNNPWDLTRTAGGSSGGSAAALAAGLTPLELGSDVAGSIRIPSSFCGVAGHVPTPGVVPRRGHVPPAPGSLREPPLGVVGPMARWVEDLELALGVLAGPDAAGVPGGRLPPPAPRVAALRGCRVAVWLDSPLARTERSTKAVLSRAVGLLADAGADVLERVRPPRPFYESFEVFLEILLDQVACDIPGPTWDRLARLAALPGGDAHGLVRLARGVTRTHRQAVAALERRAQIAAAWAGLFDRVDLVLMPCAPLPAFAHRTGESPMLRTLTVDGRPLPYTALVAWAGVSGLAGLPATAVPVGRTDDGLPVGLQVLGPPWADRSTLALAARIEALTGGFVAPPLVAGAQPVRSGAAAG